MRSIVFEKDVTNCDLFYIYPFGCINPLSQSPKTVAGCLAGSWGETNWTRPPVRGPTRLRRLGEAFSKDLVPGNRHEPGLGGVGEPRAGTTTGWDTPTDAADNH